MDIKTLRHKYDLTQEELAHKIGVAWVTVSRWENGKTQPRKIARLAVERLKKELEKKK